MTPSGIDTAKLYPILMSSGLPREALGQIWASANRTTPGMLTKEELYTVLALIGVAQVNSWVKAKNPLGWISWIMPKGSRTASSWMPLCTVKIERAFLLKHCKLSIFLSSNLMVLLILLTCVYHHCSREDGNPKAACETLLVTTSMQGIIWPIWHCKS